MTGAIYAVLAVGLVLVAAFGTALSFGSFLAWLLS